MKIENGNKLCLNFLMKLFSELPSDVLICIVSDFCFAVDIKNVDTACCSKVHRESFMRLWAHDGLVLKTKADLKHSSSRWLFLRSIKCSQLIFGPMESLQYLFCLKTFGHVSYLGFSGIHQDYDDERGPFFSDDCAEVINKCTNLVSIKLQYCGALVQRLLLKLSNDLMSQLTSIELIMVNSSLCSELMRHVGMCCHKLLSFSVWSNAYAEINTDFSKDLIYVLQNCSLITTLYAKFFHSQTNDELLEMISLRGGTLGELDILISHTASLHSMVHLFESLSVTSMVNLRFRDNTGDMELGDQCIAYVGDLPVLFVEGSVAGVCLWHLLENLNYRKTIVVFSNLRTLRLINITSRPSNAAITILGNNNKSLTDLSISDKSNFHSISGDNVVSLVQTLTNLKRLRLDSMDLSGDDFVKVMQVEGNILDDCLFQDCPGLTFEAVETILKMNYIALNVLSVWKCKSVDIHIKEFFAMTTYSSYLKALNPEVELDYISS